MSNDRCKNASPKGGRNKREPHSHIRHAGAMPQASGDPDYDDTCRQLRHGRFRMWVVCQTYKGTCPKNMGRMRLGRSCTDPSAWQAVTIASQVADGAPCVGARPSVLLTDLPPLSRFPREPTNPANTFGSVRTIRTRWHPRLPASLGKPPDNEKSKKNQRNVLEHNKGYCLTSLHSLGNQ